MGGGGREEGEGVPSARIPDVRMYTHKCLLNSLTLAFLVHVEWSILIKQTKQGGPPWSTL